MNNLREYSVGDIVEISHGFAFKGEFFSDSPPGDVLMTPGNFAIGGGFQEGKAKYYAGEVPKEYVLRPGDLLVTMTDLSKNGDTLGYPARVPCDGRRYLHNQRLGRVTLRHDAPSNLSFIQWVFRTDRYRHEVLASCTGSTVRHTSPSRIKAYRFFLPPLSEQMGISAVLGALDDKIDLNRQMNETLEAMARAVFKDWFVDFGPVRAKAEGRQSPGLSPDIASLFPDALDDDDKPIGWGMGTVSELGTLAREGLTPGNFPDELFDHYSIPAYDQGQVPMAEQGSSILSNKTIVVSGSVLLSKLNPEISRVWLPHKSKRRAVCSTEFLVFKPTRPCHAGLYCLFCDDWFSQRLVAMVTGTSKSHQRVQPQSVLDMSIITAPPTILGAFEAFADPLLERIIHNREESRTLAELRDLLLPKLMSGEIRLKDAEKAVEAVA